MCQVNPEEPPLGTRSRWAGFAGWRCVFPRAVFPFERLCASLAQFFFPTLQASRLENTINPGFKSASRELNLNNGILPGQTFGPSSLGVALPSASSNLQKLTVGSNFDPCLKRARLPGIHIGKGGHHFCCHYAPSHTSNGQYSPSLAVNHGLTQATSTKLPPTRQAPQTG